MTPQQIAIQFLVKNWKGVLIALLSLVIMGKMRYDHHQMLAAYEASEQSLQAQIAGLKDIHQRQMADMENSLQVYKDTLEQIERDYQESQDALLQVMTDKRETYGKQFSQDPAALAESIVLMYGFDYVP